MQGLQLMSWRLHQCLHVYSTWLSWLESPGACPPCASSSRTCQSGVSSPLDTFKILIVSYALTNCQVQHYTDSADVCNWHIPGSLLISSLWEWSLLLMHMLYKQFLTIPHITIKRPTSFFFSSLLREVVRVSRDQLSHKLTSIHGPVKSCRICILPMFLLTSWQVFV